MTESPPSRFRLDPDEFLRVVMGQVGILGSPHPDSVTHRRPRATEASSGPGHSIGLLCAGAAVVSREGA